MTTSHTSAGPDPVEHAITTRARDVLAGLERVRDYQNARRAGEISKILIGGPAVELPKEGVQLGSRWLHALTSEQTVEADRRGLLRDLKAGDDPDADLV